MAKLPTDRTSYGSRLAKAHQDLELIKATLADAMLQADRAPDNAELQAQVADLKKQRDRAREVIADLEAMQGAAQREEGITKTADNDKLIDQLAAVGIATSDEMDTLLPKIVALIEDVNPLLVRFLNLGAQRQQAMHALQRASGKNYGNRLLRVDGHNSMSDALVGAVIRSGIGSGVASPNLAPHIVVSVPYRVPTLEDAQRSSANDRARVLELIADAKQPTTQEA